MSKDIERREILYRKDNGDERERVEERGGREVLAQSSFLKPNFQLPTFGSWKLADSNPTSNCRKLKFNFQLPAVGRGKPDF